MSEKLYNKGANFYLSKTVFNCPITIIFVRLGPYNNLRQMAVVNALSMWYLILNGVTSISHYRHWNFCHTALYWNMTLLSIMVTIVMTIKITLTIIMIIVIMLSTLYVSLSRDRF